MIRVVLLGEVPNLHAVLQASGMDVRQLPHAMDIADVLGRWPAEVVVIDAQAQVEQALSVATQLRVGTELGLVMLMGETQRRERTLALSLGADHCFTKPFDIEEVTLCIRNLHRRLAGGESPLARESGNAPMWPERPTEGVWCFDPGRWCLLTPLGVGVQLSLAEYHLLRHLFAHGGEVVTREALLQGLDRGNVPTSSRNLDMIVSRLRKKVDRAGGGHLPVRSARGIGYVFTGHGFISDGAESAGAD